MDNSTRPARWYAPWRQGAAKPSADPADLGTAYGLELSLSAERDARSQAESRPLARLRAGWMQRLAARRKSMAEEVS